MLAEAPTSEAQDSVLPLLTNMDGIVLWSCVPPAWTQGFERGWPGGTGLFIVTSLKSDPWKGDGTCIERGLSRVCPGSVQPAFPSS